MTSTDEKVDALPNILITGTPGTGKSYLCERFTQQRLDLKWRDCSALAVEQKFIEEIDDEYDCPILDEDKLMDFMEPLMQQGGNVVEYHSCDFFPERWFQAVFVVTCSNAQLFDRLKQRGYNKTKLESNLQCEIFGTILEEARESYKPEIVFELKSDTKQEAANNLKQIRSWYNAWKRK